MSDAFYVTTPIYYVNADPHLGHAYGTAIADTLARYHRLAGDRSYFLTGSDEHGEKIAEAAAKEGVTPQEIADRHSDAFRAAWESLGFSFDRFIRTTEPRHGEIVRDVLQRIYDAGEIEFREYEGLYCVGCERFLTERDLEDGKCRDHEREPEKRKESNYFFLMSRHFDWLAETLEANPDLIRPERYRNEVLGMLREESGLGDLCISRPKTRLEWGIELPFDDGYVCYVWFDALINYLTGIGYPDEPDFEAYWSASEHVIGKDILKPHAVFWPCMLRAIGVPLYKHLNVTGYWNVDGRKLAKSLGNAVSPLGLRDQFGFDAVRYYLLRDVPFGSDSDFTVESLVARINADLANNLGNLASRTLNMTARYAEGLVPEPGPLGEAEEAIAQAASTAAQQVDTHVRACEFHRALEAVLGLANAVNGYLEGQAPWKVAKEKPEGWETKVATTLYTSCQALRSLALLLAPFLPDTAPVLLERLGVPDALDGARLPDDAARFDALAPGTPTQKGPALFPRIDLEADA